MLPGPNGLKTADVRSLAADRDGDDQAVTLEHRFAGSSPAGFPVGSRQVDGAVQSVAAFVWIGSTRSARPARCSASSVTPAFGQPVETKKARYVVALSRCPSKRPGSSPAVRPRTSFATTGTCEFGQGVRMLDKLRNQEFSWPRRKIFRRGVAACARRSERTLCHRFVGGTSPAPQGRVRRPATSPEMSGPRRSRGTS